MWFILFTCVSHFHPTVYFIVFHFVLNISGGLTLQRSKVTLGMETAMSCTIIQDSNRQASEVSNLFFNLLNSCRQLFVMSTHKYILY